MKKNKNQDCLIRALLFIQCMHNFRIKTISKLCKTGYCKRFENAFILSNKHLFEIMYKCMCIGEINLYVRKRKVVIFLIASFHASQSNVKRSSS